MIRFTRQMLATLLLACADVCEAAALEIRPKRKRAAKRRLPPLPLKDETLPRDVWDKLK